MTKIPLKVTYGIMAAVELALRHGSARHPSEGHRQAARQFPARFIEQILNTLKRAGLVGSLQRGTWWILAEQGSKTGVS